jgi:hypothetical protein
MDGQAEDYVVPGKIGEEFSSVDSCENCSWTFSAWKNEDEEIIVV